VPGTFEDIDQATASLSLLDVYDVEATSVAIVGHSAGGHLALWAAATFPERFDGTLGLAAITDLATYAEGDSFCEQSALALMGGTAAERPEVYERYSPKEMTQHPNLYLIQSRDDEIVLSSQAYALGLSDNRLTMTTGSHFELIHPESQSFESVRKVIPKLFA
jgi:pimeloyl-ACP methyl ester carboxylesterase